LRRVAILGAGGAGKTVLARRLGQLLDLPVTHLDSLRYRPDWSLTTEEEFVMAKQRVVAGPAWIVDGNSLATLPIRAAAADTIIVLDPHPVVCLLGIARRRLRYRGGQHSDGVFDRLSTEFLLYVLRYRRRHLTKVLACIHEHRRHDAAVLHLTSRRAARDIVSELSRHRTTPGLPSRGDFRDGVVSGRSRSWNWCAAAGRAGAHGEPEQALAPGPGGDDHDGVPDHLQR
jgi:adenylate kinase family enzyme